MKNTKKIRLFEFDGTINWLAIIGVNIINLMQKGES